MKTTMEKLLEFLQDDTGALSSYRLVFLLWSFCLVGAWGFVSLAQKTLVPVDTSLLHLTAVLVGGKLVQNFSESTNK